MCECSVCVSMMCICVYGGVHICVCVLVLMHVGMYFPKIRNIQINPDFSFNGLSHITKYFVKQHNNNKMCSEKTDFRIWGPSSVV